MKAEECAGETSTAVLLTEVSRKDVTRRSRSSTATDARMSSPLRDVSRTATSSGAGFVSAQTRTGPNSTIGLPTGQPQNEASKDRAGAAISRPILSLVPHSAPAHFVVRRKRLVAAIKKTGRRAERQYHATRLVVDDFGDAVAYEYRCSSCRRWGSSQNTCRDCKGWAGKMRRERDPERVRAEQARSRRELIAREPSVYEREKERHRLARLARLEQDPERERELARKRCERYRKKMKEDPERYQAYLEDARIRNTQGRAVGMGHRRVDGTGKLAKVDNAPLRQAFEDSDLTATEVAERCGWLQRGNADTSRVKRVLGISPESSGGRRYFRREVGSDTAALVAGALGLDPWEVGA